MTNNNLFVFIETNKDGSAKSVGLELLAPGKELAEAQGCEVVAVVIGNNVENAVKEAKVELESGDNDRIVKATEKLSNESQGIFAKIYQQANPQGDPNAQGGNGGEEFHQ